MKRPFMLARRGLIACMLALCACGSEPRPSAEPAPVEPAPTAPAPPAGPLIVDPALEPSPEQLPLEADFASQAEHDIDADNFRAALDTLEREIAADK